MRNFRKDTASVLGGKSPQVDENGSHNTKD